MTKRELITQLEALNVSDDTNVIIFDWQKNIDDESTEGIYSDFEIEVHHTNPTAEEIEDYRERLGDETAELKPVITLNFDNYDEPEISQKGDRELLFGLAGEIAGTTIYNVKYPFDEAAQEKIGDLNSMVAFIAKDLFDKLDEQI